MDIIVKFSTNKIILVVRIELDKSLFYRVPPKLMESSYFVAWISQRTLLGGGKGWKKGGKRSNHHAHGSARYLTYIISCNLNKSCAILSLFSHRKWNPEGSDSLLCNSPIWELGGSVCTQVYAAATGAPTACPDLLVLDTDSWPENLGLPVKRSGV